MIGQQKQEGCSEHLQICFLLDKDLQNGCKVAISSKEGHDVAVKDYVFVIEDDDS